MQFDYVAYLLRKLAFPISLLYALGVHLRNYFYDIGIFSTWTFGTPIICIGNLSVGGTGKTPMVEFLIEMLGTKYRIAVLSRGYKRKTKGFVLATPSASVAELGDEPFQLYQKYPKVTVTVDTDRRNGIRILEDTVAPEVILLDDAFQHRRVSPGFSILLTAYGKLYCDDWYVPTGDLRDSKREAKRADLIVITKCPKGLSREERSKLLAKLGPKRHQRAVCSYLTYDDMVISNGKGVPITALRDKKCTLVTGIADPVPLVDHLKSQGISFEHLRFPDHHNFSPRELEDFRTRSYLLTTEKDQVRLMGKVDGLYVIRVKHTFFEEERRILTKMLEEFMKRDA